MSDTGEMKLVFSKTIPNWTMGNLRGSGSPIDYRGGWLFTVHQVFYNRPRCYAHRFLWMTKTFDVVMISRPFYFFSFSIEYTLSICQKTDEEIYITYSLKDNKAFLATIKTDDIDYYFEGGFMKEMIDL